MWCKFDTIEAMDEGECIGFALPCKRWSCPDCVHMRCAQLRELALTGKPSAFITLTASDACGDDPDAIARMLVRSWRDVLQRGKREGLFTKPQYLCVFEVTKRGRPHLHILWRGPFIPHQWLSDRMRQYMQSPIVDIRAVKSQRRASGYVAKYVSKGPWRWKGTKRYWRSQKWSVISIAKAWMEDPIKRSWIRLPVMAHNRVMQLSEMGCRIEARGKDGYTAKPPPGVGWKELYRRWLS